MVEVWKDVPGYEGYYAVSNLGRVKSLERTIQNDGNLGQNKLSKYSERIMKPGKRKKGYLGINLTRNCKTRAFLVHRLVAEAFIPNPQNLPFINHKDENKQNNRVENLEWCTNKYNVNYGSWKEKQSIAHINQKYSSKPVVQLDKNNVVVATYPSIAEAERQTAVKHISCVVRGVRKSAGGYFWRFLIT